jgi:hypothetical protein
MFSLTRLMRHRFKSVNYIKGIFSNLWKNPVNFSPEQKKNLKVLKNWNSGEKKLHSPPQYLLKKLFFAHIHAHFSTCPRVHNVREREAS